ncbi:hypothetical protein NTGM5_50006 [Candidatus Nitrotoga sp. M5]|nr:hypothetical protein NTGM5_50006 [Candidatus Nitrotoga sp. M5]
MSVTILYKGLPKNTAQQFTRLALLIWCWHADASVIQTVKLRTKNEKLGE